jgi:TetR/AcrR family transcriptional repressor of nem operon
LRSHRAVVEDPGGTRQRILDVAEELGQTRGFNGFSYNDIAQRLSITRATLHYHFASKADLGRALISRYDAAFADGLASIDRETAAPAEKLRRYVALYEDVAGNERMCLCGMFAAEIGTLPEPMQVELRAFFDANERWLTQVFEAGLSSRTIQPRGSANAQARMLLGALEGAMLVARAYADPDRFRLSSAYMLADIVAP